MTVSILNPKGETESFRTGFFDSFSHFCKFWVVSEISEVPR